MNTPSPSPTPRITIRCPNCLKDGSARAELTNRRVSCKHCSHVFRAVPIGGDGSNLAMPAVAPAPPPASTQVPVRESSRLRIEYLEREVLKLRELLTARPDPASDRDVEGDLASLQDRLDRAQADSRKAEVLRLDADTRLAQAERSRVAEVKGLRDQLDRAEADSRAVKDRLKTLESAHADRERALVDELDDLRDQLNQTLPSLPEPESDHVLQAEIAFLRDELAKARADFEAADRAHLAAVEARDADNLAAHDRSIQDRESVIAALRVELARALDSASDADEARAALAEGEAAHARSIQDRESVIAALRDRLGLAERLAAELREEVEAARRQASDRNYPSTEFDLSALPPTVDEPPPTVVGSAVDDVALRLDRDRLRAEVEALRLDLDAARAEADRVRSAGPIAVAPSPDDAAKGTWADFERRLSETQAKLKAASARADLLEAEARSSREQAEALRRGSDQDDFGSDELGSMTNLRIMADRGTARLTPADAEARLTLARQLAVGRRDKALIDRIARMTEQVRADLEARNYTLAETLVRGAEIEAGLDPGGYSIAGLRIFRPSPSILSSLAALAPAFDRVMRQGDLASIRSTLGEMRTILGDQAGLPEIRLPGRSPGVKRPIAEAEAVRLFLGSIEAEHWLMRPIMADRPPPETALGTYATLIEACLDARASVGRHAPDKLDLLDRIVRASAVMLVRRQQADGHFAFLDPRGRPCASAEVVEAMVAARPDSVKDGWVVGVDPAGLAQIEAGACGVALARAGSATGQVGWSLAGSRAADWAAAQPCLPNFLANAASARLLARAYRDGRGEGHLGGLLAKLAVGLLPGQVDNGRWIDPASARTPDHLLILRALHDGLEALPAERDLARADLVAAIDRAMRNLLDECGRIGVPAQGGALRDLVRHRELTAEGLGLDADPRLDAAILDAATVVLELCHDGPRIKLGVAPDQVSALVRA